jgi:hypothetical protein
MSSALLLLEVNDALLQIACDSSADIKESAVSLPA